MPEGDDLLNDPLLEKAPVCEGCKAPGRVVFYQKRITVHTKLSASLVAFFLVSPAAVAGEAGRLVDAGEPFGPLPLVDEIDCGRGRLQSSRDPEDARLVKEDPAGASRIETILGRKCRVLPRAGGAKYFAYCIGKEKGLVPGAAYVLSIEYPEDRPRSMFIGNRGAETDLGFGTGRTVGDVLKGRYVGHNPESLGIPLSGKYQTWKSMFYLHDRFAGMTKPRGPKVRPDGPADGFWVVICQSKGTNHPMSAGAAVSRVRLFHVPNPKEYDVRLNLPPEGLPRRHLFWREEMSDGVVSSPEVSKRGVKNPVDWYEYKARLMKFWGMNTFCKDLLEFGHNQGWDSTIHGGSAWVNQSKQPHLWRNVLAMIGKYGFDVLPYYEYAGSIGQTGRALGTQKRCVTLGGGRTYTHIKWSEKANADITDPDTLDDLKKILDATVIRHREKANFLGVWLRPRPSAIPVSFSDRCLGLFAAEANDGAGVTSEQLKRDGRLLGRYYRWWFGKRRDFLIAVRDYLRERSVPEAVVLFTTDTSEPGRSLPGVGVVADDPAAWSNVPEVKKVVRFEDVTRNDLYLKALLSPRFTWGKWEWQHSCPRADPESYKKTEGVMLTYTFNRAYTVSSAKAFDAFRAPSGLAIVRHYPLNENEMEKKLGYFVSDVERAGPYCMLGEARAMAHGDPRYIGYLASNCFNRGFPQYVRRFNAAFLSLPALPSEVVENASTDPDVVVRVIPTERRGTYFAVVNTGFEARKVTIRLPVSGRITDAAQWGQRRGPDFAAQWGQRRGPDFAATGEQMASGSSVDLSLGPCELRALHVARGFRLVGAEDAGAVELYKRAESHFVKGEFVDAKELFRQIVNEYASSIYARKAKEYLGLLD